MAEETKQPEAVEKKMVISRVTSLMPANLGEANDIAVMLAKSDAIPKEFMGKPANVLLAVMHGHAVGLTPAQALSSIMVVNNRCSIWGDALLGIVKTSSEYEWSRDGYDPNVEGGTAWFEVKRKGEEPLKRTFSVEDAKTAGLNGKPGPWQQYKKRMLYMRARAFALRDAFGDVLKGLRVAEEERDLITVEATVHTGDKSAAAEFREEVSQPQPTPAAAAPQETPQPAKEPEAKPVEQTPAAQAPAAQPAKKRRF